MRDMQQVSLSRRLSVERWLEPRAVKFGVAIAWSPYSITIAVSLITLHVGATWYRGKFIEHFKPAP